MTAMGFPPPFLILQVPAAAAVAPETRVQERAVLGVLFTGITSVPNPFPIRVITSLGGIALTQRRRKQADSQKSLGMDWGNETQFADVSGHRRIIRPLSSANCLPYPMFSASVYVSVEVSHKALCCKLVVTEGPIFGDTIVSEVGMSLVMPLVGKTIEQVKLSLPLHLFLALFNQSMSESCRSTQQLVNRIERPLLGTMNIPLFMSEHTLFRRQEGWNNIGTNSDGRSDPGLLWSNRLAFPVQPHQPPVGTPSSPQTTLVSSSSHWTVFGFAPLNLLQ
nr:hypothetical protein Itr_chr10CG01480 [Ipomoea trifida]